MRMKRGRKSIRVPARIDVAGATFLAATITAFLCILFSLAAPYASADDKNKRKSAADPATIILDKKFKGHLPITQLTEDQAILHALDRLAYGPRPGDVEHIRKIGLEKWIDQQLDPGSIDDSALEERLSSYKTLTMSPGELLATFPKPNAAVKRDATSIEEYRQQMKEKQQEAVADVKMTGNDNIDRANQQLAKMQGPARMLAELSMAKVDRAIYSHRQLEASWKISGSIISMFSAGRVKTAGSSPITCATRFARTLWVSFDDLLIATAKSPAMLFYLDNWLSADPAAFQKAQQQKNGRPQRSLSGRFRQRTASSARHVPWSNNGLQRSTAANAQAAASSPGARPQRKLRPRSDGAAHRRRGRRLHPAGRDRNGQIALPAGSIREPRKDPEFFFKPEFHAEGKKVVMGHTFDYGGMKDGEEALKMLASDPHTAKFISTKLARHFVSDNPPQCAH